MTDIHDTSVDECEDIANDDLYQFVNIVGDIADRIRSLPNCRVEPKEIIFVSCILAGDFQRDELFRHDYDGMPNQEDEHLLRNALTDLEDIFPDGFHSSEAVENRMISQRTSSQRASLAGHFRYAPSTPDGTVVICHKETRIRRMLSRREREIITDYYVHNMLDDVCGCCREMMT